MEIESAQYLTIEDFAKIKDVPVKAVEVAIRHHKLSCRTDIVAGQKLIACEQLDAHNFELISAIEYSERRKINRRSVYNKLESGIIEPSDFVSQIGARIDWNIFHDVHFKTQNSKAWRQKS